MLWEVLKNAGGSLAVVTAVLYAAGFLALQAHLTLLGVATLVDVDPLRYLLTGATFFYTVPALLFGGAVFTLPAAGAAWAIRRWLSRRRPLIVVSMIAAIAGAAVILVVALLIPPGGLLFGSEDTFVTRHLRRGADGRTTLLVLYAAYLAHVVLFVVPSGVWLMGRMRPSEAGFRSLQMAAASMLGMLVLLVPVIFGCYVIDLRFPRVVITGPQNGATSAIDGWILNQSLKPDSPLVLYVGEKSRGSVVVIKKEGYGNMQVLQQSYLVLPEAGVSAR